MKKLNGIKNKEIFSTHSLPITIIVEGYFSLKMVRFVLQFLVVSEVFGIFYFLSEFAKMV